MTGRRGWIVLMSVAAALMLSVAPDSAQEDKKKATK